ERMVRDAMLQRHAVKKLHRDERAPALIADVVDGTDVGMVERRGSLGFAAESFQRLRVVSYRLRKELEGDKTVEPGILSLVHHAHPPAPELFQDGVVGNRLTQHRRILGWDRRQVNQTPGKRCQLVV